MKELILNNATRVGLDLKKLHNIYCFCSFSREGLSWNKHERRILLYETEHKERIFMRYPGKESDPSFMNGKINRKLNPYDFKPDLVLEDGCSVEPGSNLSLGLMIESFVKRRYQDKSLFISFLLNMAYYNVHKWDENGSFSQDVFFRDGRIITVQQYEEIDFVWSRLVLPKEILRIIRGVKVSYNEQITISVEALIYYIDVLAIQEDCKYQRERMKAYCNYVEETNTNDYDTFTYEKDSYCNDKKYNNHIGRINFISTLARVAYNTSVDGHERTKVMRDLLYTLKANNTVRPIPLNWYENITKGNVIFSPDDGVED